MVAFAIAPLLHVNRLDGTVGFLHCLRWCSAGFRIVSFRGLQATFTDMASRPADMVAHNHLRSAPTAIHEESSFEGNASKSVEQDTPRARGETLSSVRTFLGLRADAPIDEEHEDLEHHDLV